MDEEKKIETIQDIAEEKTETVQNEIEASDQEMQPKRKKLDIKSLFTPKNRKKTIVACIAVLLVICAGIGVLNYFSLESMVKRFCKAEMQYDIGIYQPLFAYDGKAQMACVVSGTKDAFLKDPRDWEKFFKDVGDKYDEDVKSWKDVRRVLMADRDETLLDLCGKYVINTRITKSKTVSSKKLLSEVGNVSHLEKYGFDEDKVQSGALVTVKMKVVGDDETLTCIVDLYMVKIDGFWKVLDYDRELED